MGTDQQRALLAVALSAIVLFGWQIFFAPKQPAHTKPPRSKKIQEELESPSIRYKKTIKEGRVFFIKEGKNTARLDENLVLKDISFEKTSSLSQIIGQSVNPFEIQVLTPRGYESFKFKLTREKENLLVGNNDRLRISFIAKMTKDKLMLRLTSRDPLQYRFVLQSKEKQEIQKIRQFLVFTRNDVERIDVGDNEFSEGMINWFGVDFDYHLLAFDFFKKKEASYKSDENDRLFITLLEPVQDLQTSVVFTKKYFDKLASYGNHLEQAVDLDIWFLAIPILRGLQFFYNHIQNYGWCIVVLTLIIRLITFPLQYKSFKSMKKMQVLQPELVKIREKYKEDSARMQRETMDLFKRHGTNPMGGCLPMLLQLPIFFAFYSVLREAVELVEAPFLAHIKDLSLKDPYYILPILVCLIFFINQKVTPTPTTDPTQKKIMMFLPIVFGFIMKDLPSGLSLYILVSTFFGIIQQMLVYRFSD